MPRKNKQTKNNKKKGNSPKPTTMVVAPRPPRAPRAPKVVDYRFAKGICSVSNPFCPEAVGGRWPDNSFTKTLTPNIVASSVTFGTAAAGYASLLFIPGLSFHYVFPSGGVYPSTTYAATAQTLGSFSNVSRWRITSWGLKISTPTSPLNTSGMVRIRMFSPQNAVSLSSSSLTSNLADDCLDFPVSRLHNSDCFIVPMPLGHQAREYRSYAIDVTGWQALDNIGWQYIQVGIDGASTANAVSLNVSVYYHYETVPNDGSTDFTFARAPPPNVPAIQDGNASVLGSIGNFIVGTAEKVDRLFQTRAGQFMGRAALSYALGPAKGASNAAAMLLDV